MNMQPARFVLHATLFLFSSALLFSCEEVGPSINLKNNENVVADTNYVESPVPAAEQKYVMLEEFTGVRCPNCPAGHQMIEQIKTNFPGRVVSISYHPINSLGTPYAFPVSVEDLQRPKAEDLFSNYFGNPGYEPTAAIDRITFAGEASMMLPRNKWNNYVQQRLAQTPPVNLLLSKGYNTATRELTVIVELHYTKAVSQPNRLTIALSESNIISAQLDGSIVDTFYNHKDVFRDFLTDTRGDAINAALEPGRVVKKVYVTTLDSKWKPENVNIVAFVHEYQNSKTVHQAKEIHVTP